MKISKKEYAIITSEFPILFMNLRGYLEDELTIGCLFECEESANQFLEECDEPDAYRVIEVNARYEF